MWVVGTVLTYFLVSVGHLSRDDSPTELTGPTFLTSRDHFSNIPPLRRRSNKHLAWEVTPRTKTMWRYRIHSRDQKRRTAWESHNIVTTAIKLEPGLCKVPSSSPQRAQPSHARPSPYLQKELVRLCPGRPVVGPK